MAEVGQRVVAVIRGGESGVMVGQVYTESGTGTLPDSYLGCYQFVPIL